MMPLLVSEVSTCPAYPTTYYRTVRPAGVGARRKLFLERRALGFKIGAHRRDTERQKRPQPRCREGNRKHLYLIAGFPDSDFPVPDSVVAEVEELDFILRIRSLAAKRSSVQFPLLVSLRLRTVGRLLAAMSDKGVRCSCTLFRCQGWKPAGKGRLTGIGLWWQTAKARRRLKDLRFYTHERKQASSTGFQPLTHPRSLRSSSHKKEEEKWEKVEARISALKTLELPAATTRCHRRPPSSGSVALVD